MPKPRARDLGIPFEGTPGKKNAITDVAGVAVGHTTLIAGKGKLRVGKGPVRTGVTAILPRGKKPEPVFAAWHTLNGCGEMTGTIWVEESGFLYGPVMITNTLNVSTVRDATITWGAKHVSFWFSLPVVAETYDGSLNDIRGQHVKPKHVWAALDSASTGAVAEGNVGGGTGMICHEFKGGIGTSSRALPKRHGGYAARVGVLVQANHGSRKDLRIAGVPVGAEISDLMPGTRAKNGNAKSSSIIVVVATDCPLLPHQLKRLAKRVPLGIARVGGIGENLSGDIFIAFSTARFGKADKFGVQQVAMYSNYEMDPLFDATVQATEEAIINALVAAETMEGINGYTVHALPHDRLREVMRKYNRLVG
jgi:L-aminopeptidase/D-esterase-like protein